MCICCLREETLYYWRILSVSSINNTGVKRITIYDYYSLFLDYILIYPAVGSTAIALVALPLPLSMSSLVFRSFISSTMIVPRAPSVQ